LDELTTWQAIILGIVEGITEYLPVSSTGHLILTSALLGLDEPESRKRAVDAFNIVIQGGAILAVLGLYFRRVMQMLRGVSGRDSVGLKLAVNLFVAFLPAAIFGVLLDDWIESRLFFPGPVVAALALGGIAMIAIGPWQRRFFHGGGRTEPEDSHAFVDLEHLTWKRALLIGLLQCVAMWPGTSRSMVTIVGGMLAGMRPKHAAEFSFLLGLPTLGGACVYKFAKNFMGEGPNMIETLGLSPLIVGFIVATISAALAVKWLVAYLTKHGLAVFGWYRLALSAVMIILIVRGAIAIAPV
jgi:undecaprenyl-diphosphatase